MTGALIRRRDLDTDAREGEDTWRVSQRERPWKKKPCRCLDLGLVASGTVRKRISVAYTTPSAVYCMAALANAWTPPPYSLSPRICFPLPSEILRPFASPASLAASRGHGCLGATGPFPVIFFFSFISEHFSSVFRVRIISVAENWVSGVMATRCGANPG